MNILTIVTIVFLCLEATNVIAMYFFPGSKNANAVGIFKAWEKSKSDPEIHDFLSKWYSTDEADPVQRQNQMDDLMLILTCEPRIRALASNPLLLTIIALVYRSEAVLPHERVRLYDRCITALLNTWEEIKGLSPVEKQRPFYRYRRRLLERLAYELHASADHPGRVQMVKQGNAVVGMPSSTATSPSGPISSTGAVRPRPRPASSR